MIFNHNRNIYKYIIYYIIMTEDNLTQKMAKMNADLIAKEKNLFADKETKIEIKEPKIAIKDAEIKEPKSIINKETTEEEVVETEIKDAEIAKIE